VFVIDYHIQPCLMFVGKIRCRGKHIKVLLLGWLLALLKNTRPVGKAWKITLAYLAPSRVTKNKKFYNIDFRCPWQTFLSLVYSFTYKY
jgi:hypothetical protein